MIDTVIVFTYLAGALACWVLMARWLLRRDPSMVGPIIPITALAGVIWPAVAIGFGARAIAIRYARSLPPVPASCPTCGHQYRTGRPCLASYQAAGRWYSCTCQCPREVHAARFGARP